MKNNLSPGYSVTDGRQGCNKWMQVFRFIFYFFPSVIFRGSSLSLRPPFAVRRPRRKASPIKVLPDNDVASPAARRACQPAGGIEVNKPKRGYMLRDGLLWEQRGSGGTVSDSEAPIKPSSV